MDAGIGASRGRARAQAVDSKRKSGVDKKTLLCHNGSTVN